MREGRIVQLDEPTRLYKNPVNIFVADFLGVSNIVPGQVVARDEMGLSEVRIDNAGINLLSTSPAEPGASVHVCMRPEHLHILERDAAPVRAGNGDPVNVLSARVQVANFLGGHTRYLGRYRPCPWRRHAGCRVDRCLERTAAEGVDRWPSSQPWRALPALSDPCSAVRCAAFCLRFS
jgi:ABC-type Fe3+/spermidine/putrescine transport system ATPase subunit